MNFKISTLSKKQHKMNEKNSKKKDSPLVIKSLMFELQPTHGKVGRRSTIPTKETKATTTEEQQHQELGW
jgi:hypothetical protein